jgi:hypothetical protein
MLDHPASSTRVDLVPLFCIAAAFALAHILTSGRYGFHADELQFLSDGLHMDWGFVAYPPLTPFLARVSMSAFGLSLIGLRLFPAIALAAAVVTTALMARELGGGQLAQVTAALVVALSPQPLFEATKFRYTSFDYLWWVLTAYFTIQILKSENPRWWLAIGGAIGIGLLTKYSILFYVVGILAGAALTNARRYFASYWFWAGVGIALLMILPNLVWQVQHDFISYRFLQFIHTRDIELGRTDAFLPEQLMHCINVFAAPLCVAGLVGYLRSRRYRMLAWMYLAPLVLFIVARSRSYYLAPAYPMLIAMGCAAGERWVALGRKSSAPRDKYRGGKRAQTTRATASPGRLVVAAAFFTGLTAWGVWVSAMMLPFASDGPLQDFALKRNEDLRNEFGWNELVRTVAGIRDSLPADQKAHLGVIVGNYGEQGAIEILGKAYHLPAPISGNNSAWLRGYPTPQPTTLIVLGFNGERADLMFTGCRLAANRSTDGVVNEEGRDHPDIFVCGPPRVPWPEFWKDFLYFG